MHEAPSLLNKASARMPPHVWFAGSAVFHYLGPAFAVLLFPVIGVLGVAWFRIASAALIFALLVRPWRIFATAPRITRLLLIGLGLCLAAMNTSFYLALERLPMSLVAAMEFVGTLIIAFSGVRSLRNGCALALAVSGVLILIDVDWKADVRGLFWATLNAALFTLYIVLGHRAAQSGAKGGVDILGAAMAVAFVVIMPIGFSQAREAFADPALVAAGVGVGICSSVIPYLCDQLAMARLPRASFAFMLALLPATATIIAALVLGQIPGPTDLAGIALVMTGIALHQPAQA